MGFTGLVCGMEFKCGRCALNKCSSNTMCTQCQKGWKGENCLTADCNSLGMCKNGGMNK